MGEDGQLKGEQKLPLAFTLVSMSVVGSFLPEMYKIGCQVSEFTIYL